jgi:branched-chain amino acid transport system ATP-binding protein
MRLLETTNLVARYGDFQALFGVGIAVDAGQVVALIGANGAGKSTTLKAIAGLLPTAHPEDIRFAGAPIGGLPAEKIVSLGIALVPEGRRLFPSLSVEDNLKMGAFCGNKGAWTLERVFSLFPVLKKRRAVPATSLSGGEQQMAAIGRALMTNPKLLLCDEISLGLSPIIVRDLYASLADIRGEGTSIVIVEQDVKRALRFADYAYCMLEGRVSLEGAAAGLSDDAIRPAYFGI